MAAMKATSECGWELWQKVRSEKPLIQCITNFVSMDFMANTLLAAGASPAMVSRWPWSKQAFTPMHI